MNLKVWKNHVDFYVSLLQQMTQRQARLVLNGRRSPFNKNKMQYPAKQAISPNFS
jgi:hypothetical protein